MYTENSSLNLIMGKENRKVNEYLHVVQGNMQIKMSGKYQSSLKNCQMLLICQINFSSVKLKSVKFCVVTCFDNSAE